ncbi:MAG: hypothetical protein EXR03_03420 [Pseudolabrys sp.]|nr:hypothetical protein [Pseudolabrys sp.]
MSPAARSTPRSLAGATILQLVPALRDDPAGHAAVDIALTLLRSGARAIVAGDGGPLVGELRAFGGEWLPMPNDTFNPLRIRSHARQITNLIAGERIDIVHAQSAGGAWSALAATDRMPVFLVTSFPDRLPANSWPGNVFRGSLARGDRVIAPSSYVSHAMIARYKIPAERVTVIPRSVDTTTFNPALVRPERIAALRRAWGGAAGFPHRAHARADRTMERTARACRCRAPSGRRRRTKHCFRACRRRPRRCALHARPAPARPRP